MKHTMIIALFVLFASSFTSADKKADGNNQDAAQQEVTRLEGDFYKAYEKGDVATIDRLLAPDYTHNDIRGGLKVRADYMMYINALADQIKAGKVTIVSARMEDLKVRVYGETAVATGRWTAGGQRGGKEDSEQMRFTHVWVKRDGRWQGVAGQVTLVTVK
jgi:ketosteroid isomerase-like protein